MNQLATRSKSTSSPKGNIGQVGLPPFSTQRPLGSESKSKKQYKPQGYWKDIGTVMAEVKMRADAKGIVPPRYDKVMTPVSNALKNYFSGISYGDVVEACGLTIRKLEVEEVSDEQIRTIFESQTTIESLDAGEYGSFRLALDRIEELIMGMTWQNPANNERNIGVLFDRINWDLLKELDVLDLKDYTEVGIRQRISRERVRQIISNALGGKLGAQLRREGIDGEVLFGTTAVPQRSQKYWIDIEKIERVIYNKRKILKSGFTEALNIKA